MKKILIVEDESGLAETLKMRFEANGYQADIAGDGQEALAKVRENRPNLILLDIMIPKIDGYKVCRILKFDEKYKNIPILMLTAKTQEEDKELGYSVGANAYLTKPFDTAELMQKIKELLGEI
jgi:two-component system alkaline phosphatase synthesis response regulator PhoP